MKNLKKTVILHCPICGNDQFTLTDCDFEDLAAAPDETRIKCSDCQNVFTKSDLIQENQSAINANIEDFKKDVVKEIENEIKKKFKKLR